MSANEPSPLVSVCIPTYNGEKWLRECIDSALGQTHADIEVLVVDDCSSDDTVEVARSFKDARVRVVVNERNRGLVGNWNESVRLARGRFVKFLFQDDILYPTCVKKMLDLFREHPSVGLVFSPRDIIVAPDIDPEYGRSWVENAGELHTRYSVRPGLNDGRELFAQHVRQQFYTCCVGEPTTVLVRREVFERVGLFNPLVRQTCDAEMWLRIMYFYDVGFVEEKLCAFRLHASSATADNIRKLRHVYDPIWLLEGLLGHAEIRANEPELVSLFREKMRRNSPLRPSDGWLSLLTSEGRRAAREQAPELPRRARLHASYLLHRLRRSPRQRLGK